jgi:hypothetical protein
MERWLIALVKFMNKQLKWLISMVVVVLAVASVTYADDAVEMLKSNAPIVIENAEFSGEINLGGSVQDSEMLGGTSHYTDKENVFEGNVTFGDSASDTITFTGSPTVNGIDHYRRYHD